MWIGQSVLHNIQTAVFVMTNLIGWSLVGDEGSVHDTYTLVSIKKKG